MPDISELTREARKADRVDRERARLFAKMVASEGWKEYVKLIDAKIQGFSDRLLAPASSLDGMVESEWVKGAMSGLIMARDVPSVTIAAMEELRRTGLQGDDDVADDES